MNFKTENIPKEMKKMRNWVLYVKEKDPNIIHPKKVMISTNGRCWHKAKSNDKNDWSSFYGCLSSSTNQDTTALPSFLMRESSLSTWTTR